MLKRLLTVFYSSKTKQKSAYNLVDSLIEISVPATFLASKVLNFCDLATNDKEEKEFFLFVDVMDPVQLEKKEPFLKKVYVLD